MLYAAVEDMSHSSDSKPLFRDLESKLKCFGPLISAIAKTDINLDRDHDQEELQIQLEKGHQLIISYHSKGKSLWNPHKKWKYTKKLLEFSNSLDACLHRLNVQQVRSTLITVIEVNKIAQQVEELSMAGAINSADVTETESDVIQVQPFPRRIHNWLVNGSYGSWRIVFMIPFLLSIVMAATTGSTGTKWFVFNIGINNLGINNN